MAGLNAILVDASSSSDDITGKSCNSHYFRTSSTDAMVVAALRALVKDSGVKSWSIIGQDYALGHDFARQFDAMAKEAGATAQAPVLSPLGNADFGTHISQLTAKGSEGLAVAVIGSDGIAFAKQQQQFGLFKTYKLVVSMNFTNEISLPAQGDTTVGVYSAVSYVPDLPGAKNADVVKLFQEKFKRPTSFVEADAWQAIEVLRAAIEQARSTDVAAVRNALAKVRTTTIFGDVEMRPDHQLQRPVALVQVEEDGVGKARMVTRKILTAAAVAPPVLQNCN
jgi:branched-chain amino acid transport system substrate-binding protein